MYKAYSPWKMMKFTPWWECYLCSRPHSILLRNTIYYFALRSAFNLKQSVGWTQLSIHDWTDQQKWSGTTTPCLWLGGTKVKWRAQVLVEIGVHDGLLLRCMGRPWPAGIGSPAHKASLWRFCLRTPWAMHRWRSDRINGNAGNDQRCAAWFRSILLLSMTFNISCEK